MNSDLTPISQTEVTKRTRFDKKPQRPMKYSCDLCHNCLSEHNYKHNNIKPYICELCDESFRYSSQFAMHRRLCGDSKTMIKNPKENIKSSSSFEPLPSPISEEKLNPILEPQSFELPSLKMRFPNIFS